MQLTNSIQDYSNIFHTKSQNKVIKHVTKYIHVVDDSGNYIKTQEISHYSWSRNLIYNNIDIYSSDEFLGLRSTFENHYTKYNGAVVEFKLYKEKTFKVYRNTKTNVAPIHGKIILYLERPTYSYNKEDKNYFRMRSCHYDPQAFPCMPMWVQILNRPCHYVSNVDTSQNVFDENTVYVYMKQDMMKRKLYDLILEINTAKSRVKQYEHHDGTVNSSVKNEKLREFITTLFDYSIKLFYINTSYGWNYSDLNYELIWNLALYILETVKPFKDGIDWLEGVQTARVRYMLEKRLYNIKDGVDVYLMKRAVVNSVILHEQNMFPKESSEHDKFTFKVNNPSKKQNEIIERNKTKEENKLAKKKVILERNKQIKEMYTQGKSVYLLASLFKLSVRSVYSILKS